MKTHEFLKPENGPLSYYDSYRGWTPILHNVRIQTLPDGFQILWGAPANNGAGQISNGEMSVSLAPSIDKIVIYAKSRQEHTQMSLLGGLNLFRSLLNV